MRWKRTRMCLITGDYMAHHQMAWCSCISLANGFIIPNFRLYDYRSPQMVTNSNDLGPPNSDGVLRFTECMMTGSTSKAPLKCLTNDHTVVGSLVPRGLCAWTAPSPPVLPADWLRSLLNHWATRPASSFFFYFFLFLSWQLIYCHILAGFTQQTSLPITDSSGSYLENVLPHSNDQL